MTPNEFPYIKAIHVNDCFAYQNFDINLPPLNGKPFSHLILTGKNGSGKTTILRGVEQHIGLQLLGGNDSLGYIDEQRMLFLIDNYRKSNRIAELNQSENKLTISKSTEIIFDKNNSFKDYKGKSIFSYLKATNREANPKEVVTPTRETDFSDQLVLSGSTDYFRQQFKQYLVNKKVQQAFRQLDNKIDGVKIIQLLFEKFIKILKRFFEDDGLTLTFKNENYEFYIELSGGRHITFNQMSDGFAAFITILVDLLIREDLIRTEVKDNSYDPCGIVLLDEPEAHLHIKAQYDVLPILTEFFPNVQFIVATHSPAVISSIKNTTIFDLTSKRTVTDRVVGSSYSELMVSHFGLDNEFSPIADKIMDDIKTVKKEFKNNKPVLKEKLSAILMNNEEYLSPVLQLELNSLIMETTF
jgi:predicted ATP-binding protein involved in virulence